MSANQNSEMNDPRYKEFETAVEKQRVLTVPRAFLVYAVLAVAAYVLCFIFALPSGGNTTWTSDPFSLALLEWLFLMLGGIAVMLPVSIVIAVVITNKKIQAIREEYGVGEWKDTVTIAGVKQTIEHKMNDEEKVLANKVLKKSLIICAGLEFAADMLSVPMMFLKDGYNLFYEVAGIYIVAVLAIMISYNRGCVNFAKTFHKVAAETPSEIRHKIIIRGILISIAHCLFAYIMISVARGVGVVRIW